MDVATRPPGLDSSFPAEIGVEAAKEAAGPPQEASAETGTHDAPDAVVDSATESAVPDAGDAGPEAANDAGVDAVVEAAPDTGIDSPVGPPGPSCPAPGGGFNSCKTGEHCCVDAPTRATTCAATCDTGQYPVDCPGASGPGGCGTQTCCGTLEFDGGPSAANCYVPKLTGNCADSCNDNFPATVTSCRGTFTVQLCTAAADCAGDVAGNIYCCNFGNPAGSFNWCVAATLVGVANMCLQ